MELLTIVLLAAVLAAVGCLLWVLQRRLPAVQPGSQVELARSDAMPNAAIVPDARTDLDIVHRGAGAELVLNDVRLMGLEPWKPAKGIKPERVGGTWAQWLGSLLDNPRFVEFVGGEQWVLAKVPQAIKEGGKWVEKDGVKKAVARAANGQFAGNADLVGGRVIGAAAALGPAIIGGLGAAYAHQQIAAGIQRVEEGIQAIDRRLQAGDLGVVDGSRRLLVEMEEWGPPHRWPDQLRTELAVRRASLDPVCFAQRAAVEHLVASMLKDGQKFRGLDAEDRATLERSMEILTVATLTRAQITLATTMILLDSEDAPFGLERLNHLTSEFVEELELLAAALQTALDGKRPHLVARAFDRIPMRRKLESTERVVGELLETLRDVAGGVGGAEETEVLLAIEDGSIVVATPPLELGPGTDDGAVPVIAAMKGSETVPIERS